MKSFLTLNEMDSLYTFLGGCSPDYMAILRAIRLKGADFNALYKTFEMVGVIHPEKLPVQTAMQQFVEACLRLGYGEYCKIMETMNVR